MDSITQAVLGAAVGEAVLGEKAGRRASIWGAALGTLPDLDVLVGPFVSAPEALIFHRGPSHALVFAFVAAPLFGRLQARLHRKKTGATWQQWAWLSFWAIFTHPLLDAFTTYGTQNFWPFTRYPVAISSISIIDPLYTLPLLFGLVVALFHRPGSHRRCLFNTLGLWISSAYLLLTLGNKIYVDHTFERALQKQDIAYETLFTGPSLFNNLLWFGLAEEADTVWVGLYSVLDEDREIAFRPVRKHEELLDGLRDDPPVETVFWFTRGFHNVREEDGELYIADMHLGRSDMWLNDEAPPIFSFRLIRDPEDPNRVLTFEQSNPFAARDPSIFRRFWRRILGDKTP